MAIQTKLGRVQGAGVFVTTAEAHSGANQQYVSRSSIFPTEDRGVKPLVGDTIIFANGIVGIISDVQSSSSIRCSTNSLFSLKGKDGLNITKVEQTTTSTESGGINVVTFTLSDGSKYNVQIANGQEGGSGVDGLIVKQEGDENILYLTKADETFGEGIPLPKGGGSGGGSTNFILNPDFSVNQRGQEEYTGTQTVDCFEQNTVEGYNVKSIPTADGIELRASVDSNLFGPTIEKWYETAVPVGIVEMPLAIYANTSLNTADVAKIAKNLQSVLGTEAQTVPVFEGENNDGSGNFTLLNFSVSRDDCWIDYINGSDSQLLFCSSLSLCTEFEVEPAFAGWNPSFDGVITIDNIKDNTNTSWSEVNESLAGIFSISPPDKKTKQPEQGKALFTQAIEDAKKLEGKTVTLSVNASVATQEGGTAVPNDGTFVENIYFNTALSADEVVSILSTLTYIDIGQTTDVSLLACKSDASLSICATHNKENGSYMLIDLIADNGQYWFDSTTGWNADFNGTLLFDGETIAEIEGAPIGVGNDKLVDIFSITPNFGSAKGELMLGYTSESEGSNEIGGTVVPNDGTFIESVYVNTSLTPDEVNSIIASANLSFVDYNGMPAYFMLLAGTTAIGVVKMTTGYVLGLFNLATGEQVMFFGFEDGYTWFDFTNPIEINGTTTNEIQGLSVGAENNKLLDIFSTTPNFGSGSSSGGTPVPNDGTVVDTIYFNTSKSIEETNAILSQLTYNIEGFSYGVFDDVTDPTTGDENDVCFSIANTSLLPPEAGYPAGFLIAGGLHGETPIYAAFEGGDVMGLGFVGWNPDMTSFTVGKAGKSVDGSGIPIGDQNDKLASIISITPDFGGGSGMVGEFTPLKNGMNSLTFEAKGLKECGIYSSANMGAETKATIHSIKLELGEEATAHLPTVTNDEKVRCQRVYQPVSLNGVVGYAKDESTLAVSIPLPVSMRALPSVESFETISILGGAEVTAIAVDSIENNSVQLSLTTSGLTVGNLYMVKNGKLFLSAEDLGTFDVCSGHLTQGDVDSAINAELEVIENGSY